MGDGEEETVTPQRPIERKGGLQTGAPPNPGTMNGHCLQITFCGGYLMGKELSKKDRGAIVFQTWNNKLEERLERLLSIELYEIMLFQSILEILY